jgi:regulator of cell morphogenesis and NO signaling
MPEPTVGEIATKTPAAIPVLEKYGIDYCCGGGRPLGEACRELGVSASALLEELSRKTSESAPEDRDWSCESLSALIEHIVSTHHAYLKSELPLLAARLDKVLEAHHQNHGPMLAALESKFTVMSGELQMHLRKEEMILFPAIEELEAAAREHRPARPAPFGSIANPIRMMITEHQDAGEALAELRRLTQNYTPPEDACATFRALYQGLAHLESDLHRHIHLENNVLFPGALKLA